jgi:hypothetical protein
MSEIWKAVPGFEGSYEVSNMGRVRSVDRFVDLIGRWGKPEKRRYKGRIRKPFTSPCNKYLMVLLCVNSRKTSRTIHSLVLEAFVGPCPPGEEGRHRNCKHHDNRLENLTYGTRKQNREDSRREGTLAVGERIAQHKLTANEVLKIRSTPADHQTLADIYGVSRSQIRRIKRRENWSHV